jgi:hypothetical protein
VVGICWSTRHVASDIGSGRTQVPLRGVGPRSAAHYTVTVCGLGTTNRNEVQPVRTGLESSNDLGRDPHDIPLNKIPNLIVKQHPSRAGDHHVSLFLLAVTMRHRTAEVRRVAEQTGARLRRRDRR